MAVEFAEEVEGVDVSHGRDVVEDGLDFAEEGGGFDVVLARELRQQQTRLV